MRADRSGTHPDRSALSTGAASEKSTLTPGPTKTSLWGALTRFTAVIVSDTFSYHCGYGERSMPNTSGDALTFEMLGRSA